MENIDIINFFEEKAAGLHNAGLDVLSYLKLEPTTEERDALLEKAWKEFLNVPKDPETACITEPFLLFKAARMRIKSIIGSICVTAGYTVL